MMDRKKIVVLLLIGVLFTSMVNFTPPVKGEDEPWLEGWTWRKSHNLVGAADAGTQYQVKMIVHYGTGSDSGNEVYLNEKCQVDFDDIRFTDNDEETLLDYYQEEKHDGYNVTVWVEVADSLSSNALIYLYYGNATASGVSNGTNTFLFFDDFEDNDVTDWVLDGGSGTLAAQSGTVKHGSYAMSLLQTDTTNPQYRKAIPAISTGARVFFWFRKAEYEAVVTHITESTASLANSFNMYLASGDEIGYYDGSFHELRAGSLNTWFKSEHLIHNSITDADIYIDDVLEVSNANPRESPTSLNYFWVELQDAAAPWALGFWDTIVIAKYVDPEPTHGTWGEEERKPKWVYNFIIGGFYFENGTQSDGEYATVTFNNGSSIEYYLDGNSTEVNTNDSIARVTWPVEFGADSGTRIIEAQAVNETHTLFMPEAAFGIYTFEIRDYTARLGKGTAYLEAYRVVNSTSYMIEKRTVIAADPYASMILVVGKVYNLRVRFSDNSTYDFGLKTMTDDVTISLPILTMSFSQKAQSTYKYVTVEATRPIFTKILVNYDDTRTNTNWGNVTIYFLNDTKVASANYSTDSFTYSYLTAVHNLTYKVRIEFDHGDFGLLPDVVTFLQGNVTYSDTPDLGAAGSVGAMDTTDLLGMIIIAVVIGAGTYRNSEAVLIAAALIAAMFSAIGFVSFDVILIEVVIGIVLIYNLVRSAQ